MSTTLLSLAMLCTVAPPLETAETLQTLLYVRTTPAGAAIKLNGTQRGTSDRLFVVPPGVRKMTVEVELDGYYPGRQQVEVRGGRITRVELQLRQRPAPTRPTAASPPGERITRPERTSRRLAAPKLKAEQLKQRGESLTNLKQLGVMLVTYAEDHKGKHPDALGELKPYGADQPLAWLRENVEYLGKVKTTADRPQIVIAYDKTLLEKADGTTVLFNDAHVEFVPAKALEKLGIPVRPSVVPEASGQAFGPVTEQSLSGRQKGVAELLDLDTGRRATMKELGRNDRETHRWIREHKMDVLGGREGGGAGLLLFDVAVWENPSIHWETIAAEEVRDHQPLEQTEPKTITPIYEQDLSKLPRTCLFRTREGGMGVLQLVGAEGSRFVKIRYKLVQPTRRQRWRHSVTIVVGKDRMTFQGKDTSWEDLPALLEEVPNRKHTALNLALASDEVTLKEKNKAVGRASTLARQFGFEYLSYIGVHPLGTKGGPSQLLPEDEARAAAKPAKKVHLPDVDTRGAEVVLDLASGEVLKIQDTGDHVRQFSRLEKGDLFFDRVLACLRGATAKRWDGKRFVDLPAEDRRFDATAYKLPEVPCRLVITTAEKKHFDVTILALTEDGGIDLEYCPVDPAVVPEKSLNPGP